MDKNPDWSKLNRWENMDSVLTVPSIIETRRVEITRNILEVESALQRKGWI